MINQTGKPNQLLGAHVSIAGGVDKAFARGESLGCAVIQIFTKNASQWKARPFKPEEIRNFHSERGRTGIRVMAHDGYLINLASPNPDLWAKSCASFREEMDRAEELEIPYLVTHPGSHAGSGEEAGLALLNKAFNDVLTSTAGYRVSILVENTAGQGSSLGYSFDHLARIKDDSVAPERIGICLDTCHAFAAGFDLSERSLYETVIQEFEFKIGLNSLKAIHLNDSKKGLGERIDRHEHIGRGQIGIACFRAIINDGRFARIPKIIETPKDETDMDVVNLSVLRKLVCKSPD